MFGEPCKECLIKTSCSEICDIATDWYKDYWPIFQKAIHCPFCHYFGGRTYYSSTGGLHTYIPKVTICCNNCYFVLTVKIYKGSVEPIIKHPHDWHLNAPSEDDKTFPDMIKYIEKEYNYMQKADFGSRYKK